MNIGAVTFLVVLGFLAHGWGDYVLQSDWMATQKVERWLPAITHAVAYTVPFVPLLVWPPGIGLTNGVVGLVVICGTHAVIDRYRLARHVIWARNRLGGMRVPWSQCRETGFPPGMPVWLATWLMIIVDNLIHITINSLVIIWAARCGV